MVLTGLDCATDHKKVRSSAMLCFASRRDCCYFPRIIGFTHEWNGA